MAKSVLTIPEKDVCYVVAVIRLGLEAAGDTLPKRVKESLQEWADTEDDYAAPVKETHESTYNCLFRGCKEHGYGREKK
jgi:hypothetical protein